MYTYEQCEAEPVSVKLVTKYSSVVAYDGGGEVTDTCLIEVEVTFNADENF